MLSRRRSYKVREGTFVHSMGCEIPSSHLRQSGYRHLEHHRFLRIPFSKRKNTTLRLHLFTKQQFSSERMALVYYSFLHELDVCHLTVIAQALPFNKWIKKLVKIGGLITLGSRISCG